MPKIIAVTGATGAQGGSVAYALLKTGQWHVRAITRNPSSDAAKALAAAGAEVVAANTDDESSLSKAFSGAHAVFAVTNFWEHLFTGSSQAESGEKELVQAMNLAKAAANTPTLEHYLWSTLAPAGAMSDGKFPCPHWDYKAKVDDLIRKDLPDLAAKTTFIAVAFYSSNLANFAILKPPVVPGSGKRVWLMPCLPSTPMAVTGDMEVNPGLWVRQVLAHPEKTKGKYISVTTETLSMGDILKGWCEVTGEEAIYFQVSPEHFTQLWGIAGAEMVSQFKNNEVVHDWESFRKADFVRPEEIGITSSEAVGHRQALEKLKERLL